MKFLKKLRKQSRRPQEVGAWRGKAELSGGDPRRAHSKTEERIKTALTRDDGPMQWDAKKLETMRRAISLAFDRTLKSNLYLQAAKRGKDDFYFLLDLNSPMIAELVLGLYQRILNEVADVDPDL